MNNFRFVSRKLIKTIKNQAKKKSKALGISHMQALNDLAASRGFHHWHHMSQCIDRSQRITEDSVIIRFTHEMAVPVEPWLLHCGFRKLERSSRIADFLFDHASEGKYSPFGGEDFYLKYQDKIFVGEASKYRDVRAFVDSFFEKWGYWSETPLWDSWSPEDLLFRGNYKTWEELTFDENEDILFDFDCYAGAD
ncbi:hypothetical protein [Endozoicomonas sp.]|uniref:hypothetical protein n=1 Tax=Endozoicomonas sp. TaxID=1892382 RepID=UPI003AF9B01A